MKLALAAALFSAVLGILGCARDDVLAPSPPRTPSFDLFVPPPGEGGRICTGYLQGQAFGGNWWELGGPLCRTELAISPGQSVYEDPYTGPYDIDVTFSEPVSNLVVTPYSIWRCGGNPGSVTIYGSSGESVTLPFTVDESQCGQKVEVYPGSECGPYWIQNGALPQANVVNVPQVTRLVIHPSSPLTWITTVYEPDGNGNCGFNAIDLESPGGGTYLLSFREFPPTTPGLVLACDQSVMRGMPVQCAARTEPPGGTLRITAWRFTANDAALGEIDREASEVTEPRWSGPMVTGGTVTVEATIAGVAKTASASIVVSARDWSGKVQPYEEILLGQGTLLPDPHIDHDLGHFDGKWRFDPAEVFGKAAVVASGPNQNLVYMTDVPSLFLRGEISTNDLAMTRGSSFWLAQVEDNPNRYFISGSPCTRSVIVTRLPDLVRRHEGVGRPPRSHAYFFTRTFDRDVGPALEPLVDKDQTTFTARVRTAIGTIGDRAAVEADAADDPGTNVMGELGCNMNFSYPSRRGGG